MRGKTLAGASSLAFAAGGRTVQSDVDPLVDGLSAYGGDVGGGVLSLTSAVLATEGQNI